MKIMKNYINGKWEESASTNYIDVTNPSTGESIAKVPVSTAEETDRGVKAADSAFEKWKKTPVSTRTSYLFKLQQYLNEDCDELAKLISLECGKSMVDSQAEMKRAIQNVEVACGMPMLMQGEKLEGIAGEMDAEVIRQPIGAFAIISPFNFPAMVPFWFLPYAIAAGNTLVVKPSEQVPLTMQRIFSIIDRLGMPAGVINMVNGGKDVSEALIAHKDIKGISFVGSSRVAAIVASESAKNAKRFQALGSAKNYLVVMEDAKLDKVVDSLLTSCYGCAGQRCMATSVVAAVPQVYDKLLEMFIEAAKKLKVGNAVDPEVDVGPVISKVSKERLYSFIEKGIQEGAKLVLDGRNIKLPAEIQNGFFIGPTIFSDVRPEMNIAQEELFGPVVSMIRIESLDEGLKFIKESKYGNGASIFTQNGYYARKFEMEASAGMIGINVGIPAPVAYFPFGGVKQSIYGDVKAQGRDVVNFYTERKIVTSRFFRED